MMRRRRHHQKPPSNRRLLRTGAGAAAEQEPTTTMMSHSHRDDDDGDRRMLRRPVVVHLQPNVIARLMGIDDADADAVVVVPTPTPPQPVASAAVQFQAPRRRQTNKRSLQPLPSYGGNDDDAEYPGSSSSPRICLHKMTIVPRSRGRPSSLLRRRRRRRHPHEEELLQKMRQDLQAWQASRAPPALETISPSDSGGGGGGSSRSSSLVLQAIAREILRRHKMARYGFGSGSSSGSGLGGHTKVTRQDELPLIKDGVAQGDTSEHAAATSAASEPAAMPDPDDRDLEAPRDGHGHGHGEPAAQAQELLSHGHTPIVLLKPATTRSESDTTATGGEVAISAGGGAQKTSVLLGLPKLHRDANMSALLQEVRDRVRRELTILTAATATGCCGEVINFKAPASARAIPVPPPLQQQVTKQDRGNKMRLFRSESFRAFRGDRKRNAGTPPAATTRHASPEAAAGIPKSDTALSPEKADDEGSMTNASFSVLRPGVIGVTDGQSFRSECLTLTTKHRDDDAAPASPRLLFRSFSAPESGFSLSLGRLFSFRQHEASEPATAAAAVTVVTSKSVVSAGFSSFIRGTVWSLRHSFRSTRPLPFRRKMYLSNKASLAEIHPANMEIPVTSPSHETFSLFKVAQANLSELPPSPVSPLEVAAGHNSRHFFSDLHFTLPELSPRCQSEFEAPVTASESSFRTDITAVEAACSRDKAYITELLIAAGLYDDDEPSLDHNKQANTRVDSMARPMPICDDVFEDVEDMYYYRGDYIVVVGVDGNGMCGGTDHRMLFDLANEALQRMVVQSSSRGGSSSSSSLRRWVVDGTGVSSRGKKLVDDVWEQVQALRNNPQAKEMQTIEGMVASEVRRCVWAEVLYEDVYVVGRKIERAIFDELIEDLLFCMHALRFSDDETCVCQSV